MAESERQPSELLTDQEIRDRLDGDPELRRRAEAIVREMASGAERGPGLEGKALREFFDDVLRRMGDRSPTPE